MRLALFVDMMVLMVLTFVVVYWLARLTDAIGYAFSQWRAIRKRTRQK